MTRFNDMMVLMLSYFPFLFTDMVIDPEAKYAAGWMFIGLVAFMVVCNLVIVIKYSIIDLI